MRSAGRRARRAVLKTFFAGLWIALAGLLPMVLLPMLGKIFDISGQRERALSEYRQALQTNDNTQAALDEARLYLTKPFERSDQ
jgi:hypothetical protein